MAPNRRDGTGKVFGIGLPKTGTSSLRAACESLGLRSLNSPFDTVLLQSLDGGDGLPDEHYDAFDLFSDVPIAAQWFTLNVYYPGAKWILTERDVDAWLESLRAVFGPRPIRYAPSERNHGFAAAVVRWAAGVGRDPDDQADRERLRMYYEMHRATVVRYIEPESLLRISLEQESSRRWRALARFVGCSLVDDLAVPWPHVNARNAGKDHVDAQ